MKTAFLSGHLDLDAGEFLEHYQHQIDAAIHRGDDFVVGNAVGADHRAIVYLLERGARFVVFYFARGDDDNVTQLAVSWLAEKGAPISDEAFKSYTDRDARATAASDYDIAWVRPAAETRRRIEQAGGKYDARRTSGTQKNIARRRKVSSK